MLDDPAPVWNATGTFDCWPAKVVLGAVNAPNPAPALGVLLKVPKLFPEGVIAGLAAIWFSAGPLSFRCGALNLPSESKETRLEFHTSPFFGETTEF